MGAIFDLLADILRCRASGSVEMARRAFKNAGARAWAGWTLGLLALVAQWCGKWGPWPQLKVPCLRYHDRQVPILQLLAEKTGLLVGVLTVTLGLLVVAFGRRYGAGWHSHVQRIVIGLSTASIAQLGAQGIWQMIARHTRRIHGTNTNTSWRYRGSS